MATQSQTVYSGMSMTALVQANINGDRDAFDEIYNRHVECVKRVVGRRIKDAAEVEELVQEVFIQAMNKLSQLTKPEAFVGWISRIAANMAINRAKRRGRLAFIDQEILEATVQDQQDVEFWLVREETHKSLHEKLKLLGQRDRDTLFAYYFEQKSVVQMSEHFAAPVGTIKRRLHTARLRLAEVCQDLAAC